MTGNYSCASCHDPDNYFIDSRRRGIGALGDTLKFNTPTLLNSAYAASLGWSDLGLTTLEAQHLLPLTNTNPIEMGTGRQQLAALWQDPSVRRVARAAFGDLTKLSITDVSAALASYVRTLIRGGSKLDAYLFYGDSSKLTPAERTGLNLFLSPRLSCSACHRGILLSGPTQSAQASFPASFYRTGVSASAMPIRAPSLRFVRATAPYMHDGSIATLAAVLTFYEGGGGSNAERLQPFQLDANERIALLAFLEML